MGYRNGSICVPGREMPGTFCFRLLRRSLSDGRMHFLLACQRVAPDIAALMTRSFGILISLFFCAVYVASGQGLPAETLVTIAPGDSTIILPHEFVVRENFALRDSAGTLLSDSLDYYFDPATGILMVGTRLREQLRSSGDTLRLNARYSWLALDIPREVYTRKLVTITDSTGAERTLTEKSEGGGLTATSVFGKDFQRSGSITRGITVGTNRDLSVQSGLRLQFSGKISEDVEVLGALTDEQTPIQPEGNTQTLREVDNIFIEVRSPVVDGTLGKFFATENRSEFTGFSRKLQGVKAVGKLGDAGETQVVAAVSPGKFRTQEFQGREGDQGPYILTGPNGERDIIVVAGTEVVFVDGVEMVRGREHDYVIDYGTGEIFFQPRRPIVSTNEIVVDFEYSDRRYSRSFLAASHSGQFIDSALRVTASYVRESDDPDAPIDLALDEDDRDLLAAAGADPSAAVRSGVIFVGRSDSASGSYRLENDSIYMYDPSSDQAVYDVVFSRAIDGEGDYRNVAFGQYEYVGPGAGEYLPVVYLPFPGLGQVGAFGVGVKPARGVDLNGEIAFSGTTVNRFSTAPGVERNGLALKGNAVAQEDSLQLAGMNLGLVRSTFDFRYVEADFQAVNRIGEAEFDRRWNAGARTGESGYDDFITEGRLDWAPSSLLDVTAGLGRLTRGDFFSSFRQEYGVRFGDRSFPLAADYKLELIASDDTLSGGKESDWLKGRGGVSYRLGNVIPGFRIEHQRRDDIRPRADTLLPGAFQFIEAGPDLQLNFPFMLTTASARFRFDDSARFDPEFADTRFLSDGKAQTWTLRGELRGVRSLRSTLDFTYRRKTYDSVPGIDIAARLPNSSILARSESRWTGLNKGAELEGVYEVQTERAARLQRVFVQVRVGDGGYIWQDLDSNGIQTENEFRETNAGDGEYVRVNLPTSELFPVIDLDATLRLNLRPERFLSDSSFFGRILQPITSETFLRVEEKSQSENESDVYLLKLATFQNEETTLLGNALVQQDFNLFERGKDFSARLRFINRSGLTQLFNDVERSRSFERSLRLNWNPSIDIGLQLDGALEDRSLLGEDLDATRAYDLSALSVETDFSYRPERSLELGWIFRVRSADDIFPTLPRSTFLTGNEIRGVYSIETRGRLRGTLERTVVEGTNLNGGDVFSLPFQLTDGYAIGTTWIGRLSFDYRFGANIQASITYTGRAEPPTNRVRHTGQAEVRAFF